MSNLTLISWHIVILVLRNKRSSKFIESPLIVEEAIETLQYIHITVNGYQCSVAVHIVCLVFLFRHSPYFSYFSHLLTNYSRFYSIRDSIWLNGILQFVSSIIALIWIGSLWITAQVFLWLITHSQFSPRLSGNLPGNS